MHYYVEKSSAYKIEEATRMERRVEFAREARARRGGQDQAVAPVVRRVRRRAHDDAIVALDDLAAEAAGQQVRAPAEAELVDLQKPAACPSRRESLAAT